MGRPKATKVSPPKRTTAAWRPNPAKRMITSFALNRATKALSTVNTDSSNTQRGNIKVVVRVRPANTRESTANARIVVHVVDSHMVVFDPPDDEMPEFYFKGVKQNYHQGKRHKNTKLAFDNVYGPSSANAEIFEDVINPMLDTLLSGFNCSVFAYGATGSGKTYTMLGSKDNPGLTFLTVMELYRRLGDMENDYETEVLVSYLEVYNETIRDLLQTSAGDLQIREDPHGVVVANLSSHKPNDSANLLELLAQGNSVRSQHPTDHNAESSRSHAVFQVYVKLRSRFTELTSNYKSAKLVMVDLAGSEKGAATGFQGQRFREGASINKSLLSLGNCINALADGKKHIPYRDSKLTRILKDSLGGNCKTVMIANVSPSNLSFDDSYNTLRYADRAKRIKFQVKKNTMSVSACLTQYTKVVEEMSHKIEMLEKEVSEYRDKCKCNVEKVDAATATANCVRSGPAQPLTSIVLPQNGQAEDLKGHPESSSQVYEFQRELVEMTDRRIDMMKIWADASSAANLAATKIGVKEKRIETISKAKSADDHKNTAKIRKQLEPWVLRREQAQAKRDQANKLLGQLATECQNIGEQGGSENVTIPFEEYLRLKNLEVEHEKISGQKRNSENLSLFYFEEWQKNETLLGHAMEVSSSLYLITKHYKKNPPQMDAAYEKLIANLSGTTVQWSDDMNTSESQVPPLKQLLYESVVDGDGDSDMNPLDATYCKETNGSSGM